MKPLKTGTGAAKRAPIRPERFGGPIGIRPRSECSDPAAGPARRFFSLPERGVRLVSSQPTRRSDDPPRTLLLVSVLCIFLGGSVVGAGGRDLAEAPRAVRAAFASLLTTGAVLFVLGVALAVARKGKKPGPARLSLARPLEDPAASEPERHFGQEERR